MKYAIATGIFAVLAGIGVFIFYLAFWVLVPAIIAVIPVTIWSGLLNFVVYAIVGWFGGIGIPVAFIFFGMYIALGISVFAE